MVESLEGPGSVSHLDLLQSPTCREKHFLLKITRRRGHLFLAQGKVLVLALGVLQDSFYILIKSLMTQYSENSS
jgi:hypothetical protein